MRIYRLSGLLSLLLMVSTVHAYGQVRDSIPFLSYNTLNKRIVNDIWLSVSYSPCIFDNIGYRTATGSSFKAESFEIGSNVEFFFANAGFGGLFHASFGLGYMQNALSVDNNRNVTGRALSHWLVCDASLLMRGEYVSFFLGSKLYTNLVSSVNGHDYFSYVGINQNCYSKFANSVYLGGKAMFSFLSMSLCFGLHLHPLMNLDNLAYYNLTSSREQRLYCEIVVSIKLFTNKKFLGRL